LNHPKYTGIVMKNPQKKPENYWKKTQIPIGHVDPFVPYSSWSCLKIGYIPKFSNVQKLWMDGGTILTKPFFPQSWSIYIKSHMKYILFIYHLVIQHSHGKSPFLKVNHQTKWIIYTIAMLNSQRVWFISIALQQFLT
jgi:hypothetical protein